MSDVAIPVDSSTPAPAAPNFEPSTYTQAETTAWMEKGTIPDVKADPSPAPVVNAAESTPAPQEQKQGKGADARKEQLNAEIRDLLAQRDKLKAEVQTDVKAAPSPAPKVEKPVKPAFGEAGHENETWPEFETRQEQHVEALVKYQLAEERKANEKTRLEAETAAQNKAIEDAWASKLEAAKSAHSDYAEVAFSKDLTISPTMDGFILDSEHGAEVLYYLGGHLDEGNAIAAMKPFTATRALIAIEAKLSEAPAPPEKKAPAVPITRAARPATDLRATNAAPADEMRAAVEADDFARFNEIENAKLLARRR